MSREEACKLIEMIRNYINNQEKLSTYIKEYYGGDQVEENVNFVGVSNGFLSEIIYTITGCKIEVSGDVEKLFTCPCCGFRTLTERYDPKEGTGYDICPYCNWEDDGTLDIQSYRAINKGSILDYRNKLHKNFNRYYINKWLKG